MCYGLEVFTLRHTEAFSTKMFSENQSAENVLLLPCPQRNACVMIHSFEVKRLKFVSSKQPTRSMDHKDSYFYNSAISKHVIQARFVVEMGSHPTKRFLFNHTTPFSTKGLEKSLCDFTGSAFVQCENPVVRFICSYNVHGETFRCAQTVSLHCNVRTRAELTKPAKLIIIQVK